MSNPKYSELNKTKTEQENLKLLQELEQEEEQEKQQELLKENERRLQMSQSESRTQEKQYQLADKKVVLDIYGNANKKAADNIVVKNSRLIDRYAKKHFPKVTAEPGQDHWQELHSKRSRTLFKDDNNGEIVEFQMGGSGFATFRNKESKGSHSKGKIDLLEDKSFTLHLHNRDVSFRPKHYGLWEKLKLGFRAIFSNSARAEYVAKNRVAEDYAKAVKQSYEDMYGKSLTLKNGKTYKHVRCKEITDKETNKHITRYAIAGSQYLFGAANAGDHSIENNVKYIRELSTNKLADWIERYRDDRENAKNIVFLLRGHSRGGVAAGLGASAIKHQAMELTKDDPQMRELLLSHLKIELIQHDPVPGAGSNSGANEKLDLKKQTAAMKKSNLEALGDNCQESTVFYSMHSDHNHWFTPQNVSGAKRVILSVYRHAVGLDEIEKTKTIENGEVKETAHSQSWKDVSTGKAYRGQGISELPAGLYFQNSQGELVRVDNKEDALKLFSGLIKNNKLDKKQDRRHEVIRSVIEDYFRDNAPAE